MTRRAVLAGLGAAAACRPEPGDPKDPGTPTGPAPDAPDEPADWAAPGTVDDALFPFGVASGDPGGTSIRLWTRTSGPATLTVVVVAEDDGAWAEVARIDVDTQGGDSVALDLDGLSPDRAHRFVFLDPDDHRSAVGRFRTAPPDDVFRKIVIGATSCLGHGDPELRCLASVADARLDALLLLGDTVYADGADTIDDYRAYWRAVAAVPTYRAAVASAGLVVAWDDHEVENNWTVGDPGPTQTVIPAAQLEAGRAAFEEALPMRPGPGGSGLWRELRFGPVHLFLLDCRGERDADTIVSEEQLAWLEGGLAASTARFKLVASSIHVTDHAALLGPVEALDRWQGYPAQRERLVAAAERAGGAVFVTGDMHYGAVQQVGAAGAVGDASFEIAAGPAGSDLFPLATTLGLAVDSATAQYLDVLDTWNWTRMTFDPGEGTVTVDFFGPDGDTVVSRVLTV